MKNNIYYVLLVSLLLIGCSSSDDVMGQPSDNNPPSGSDGGSGNSPAWLIPVADVKDGGPGKDGIPSIDAPKFVSVNDADAAFLNDTDLVVGIVNGDVVKAYPHPILDWHEVVNDKIGDDNITISYCPLTGTAFGWRSKVGEANSTFGVSGLLYNANLILYDRKSDSNWSQLGLECVNGSRIGDLPEIVQVIEMPWGAWKSMYPNTQVMTQNTGFSRNYSVYPYGPYKTNNDFFVFPASPSNDAIPNKERVFTLIEGATSKVYQFDKFGNGDAVTELFSGRKYLVGGTKDYIVAYELIGDLNSLDFMYEFDSTGDKTTVFSDNEGNKWSVYGEAISGPRKGQRLKSITSVVSYWFAIAAFYPNPQIY